MNQIVDRLDWPIASPDDPRSRVNSPDYPTPWEIAVGYAQYYLLGGKFPAWHEAHDLYIRGNADVGAPVYAIGNAYVVYAGIRPDSWDGLVVLEHMDADGSRYYSRYGHITGITIKTGDYVDSGTVIGHVGNARGRFGYHLHFGICVTDAWVKKPWHWQGNDHKWVLENCVDPREWIIKHRTTEIPPVGEGTEEQPMPEPNTTLVRVKTGGGNLNLRLTPGGAVVSSLKEGTECYAFGDMLPTGTLMWQKVEVKASHATGWAAIKYLATDPVVPVPPPIQAGSRFGLNLVGPGSFSEVIGMIDRLAKAGKPLALAVVINEAKLVAQIKAISPKTVVVFRSTSMPAGIVISGDPGKDRAAGWEFFSNYRGLTQVGANYVQFCNEWLSYDDPKILAGGVNAYLGLMEAAASSGVKITVGDLNVGHPHPALNNLLEPMLIRAEALGFPLNYHAYTKPGTTDPSVQAEGRTMRWLDFVKKHPRLKVIIGEYGPNDGNAAFPGASTAVEMCKNYDNMLKSSQVIGYAYFAAAGSTDSWKQSDVTPALPELEQWLKDF